MKSFTSMIRALVWPPKLHKAYGEHAFEARHQMQQLDFSKLRCVVGGDDMDAPKGSWIA